MTNRDYTKEIGLSTGDKNVPLPLAVPVLALIAVGIGLGLVEIRAVGQQLKALESVSKTVLPAGHTVASR